MTHFRVIPQHISPAMLLIKIEGEVDQSTSLKFKQAVFGLLEEGFQEIIMDLEAIEAIDISALGILVQADHEIGKRNGNLSLVCTNTGIKEVFHAANLSHYFEFFETIEEALAEARERQILVRGISMQPYVVPQFLNAHPKKQRWGRDVLQALWGDQPVLHKASVSSMKR